MQEADQQHLIPEFLHRHRGLFRTDDIACLANATVAIAGVGGVGGRVAEVLARSGVGRLRLADPDTFSITNLNRQAASSMATLGQSKVTAVGDLCRSVSTHIAVDEFSDGVTTENLDAFLEGADVVVDGTDYTTPSIGMSIARAAASQHTPVVLGVEIGFGVWHTVFTKPGQFERLLGIPTTATLYDVESGRVTVPLWRWIQRLPSYIDLAAMKSVESGEIEAPAIAPAVELSAALLSTDVIQLLLGRRPKVVAPRIHGVDARSGKAWTSRPSKVAFTLTALRAAYVGRAR